MHYGAWLLIALLLPSALAAAETYTVLPDGSGDFATIQAAVDEALDGDVILLGNGIFTGDGNRDVDYRAREITIRSLEGNAGLCIVECEGSASTPHRAFCFRSSEGPGSILEAITVTGGYHDEGGAVLCSLYCQPSLRKCVFIGNGGERGGALYMREAYVTVTDCAFIGNSGYSGGGVYASLGSPEFAGCTFSGNTASYGGAIRTLHASLRLTDCLLDGNTVEYDGGGLDAGHGIITATNCVFSGNTSNMSGAVHSTADMSMYQDCTFSANTASLFAGAVYTGSGDATYSGCIFIANESGAYGGAMMVGVCSSVILQGCSFIDNRAEDGGGALYCSDTYPAGHTMVSLRRVTVARNRARYGSGILCQDNTTVALERTIIAFGGEGAALRCEGNGRATAACCNLYGNEGGDWVGCIAGREDINGNISADPLFCPPGLEDLSLEATSPCAPFSEPNPDCDLIGAWDVGCGTPTVRTTWGGVKVLFGQ